MGRLSKRDMEELREACSYDCGYTDTEEVVKDITAQVLEELDSDTTYGDEVGLVDSDRGEEFTTLDEFVRIFWDKQKIHGSGLPRIWKMDLDRQ